LGLTGTSSIDDGVSGTSSCLSFDQRVGGFNGRRCGSGELEDGEKGEESDELEHLGRSDCIWVRSKG